VILQDRVAIVTASGSGIGHRKESERFQTSAPEGPESGANSPSDGCGWNGKS
jgi:hypothetical protein